MSWTTLTWLEFLKESNDFLKISQRLGDSWALEKKNDNEGNSYLVYKQKKHINSEPTKTLKLTANMFELVESAEAPPDLVQIEYHVVYSISYQVPVLYFRAHKSDGSPLELRDTWRIFRSYNDDDGESGGQRPRSEMLSILTQMEHPVLFKPFLALHPCRTAELLSQMGGTSRNRVLTFISLMGPYLQLQLCNEYGLEEAKN